MKTRITLILLLTMALLLLSSCGPTPEEIATQTASAWTSTPVPPTNTPTPTPIPFDVIVSIVDSNGSPISDASIVFPESGDDEPVTANADGSYAWFNLSGGGGNVQVNSQGYYLSETSLSLERGANDVVVQLERDPLQILPSEACPAGQEPLFIDDFEDGTAHYIQGIGRPMFEFVVDEEIGTYVVGNENLSTEGMGEQSLSFPGSHENVVFHFDIVRPRDMQILWAYLRQGGEGGYIGVFSMEGNTWLQREPEANWPSRFIARPDGLTWEHISVSAYEGAFDLWVNDELLLGVTDPDPLGAGTVAIVFSSHSEPLSLDNLVVCELTEPYNPPVVEEEATQ